MKKRLTREQFLKRTEWQLFILLLLMVAGFFTWSETVVITRIIKVVGRMGVMVCSFLVYRSIINFGAIDNLKWRNIFSSWLYFAYLALGFASFAWSTNAGFSALQWMMTIQSLFFTFFFVKSLVLLEVYFPGHKIK